MADDRLADHRLADDHGWASAWHGHTLRPLPAGESWLSGGERRPFIAPQRTYRPEAPGRPEASSGAIDDIWSFDDSELAAVTGLAATAHPAHADLRSARRTGALLIVVSVAAILTIVFMRRSGAPPEPAPLPAPPSHAITAVSRAQATTASIHVGDYLDFQLPGGRTYSTVLEQPSGPVPVVEALTLPGQQPQLRADSAGTAVIEVMAAPPCANPDGCPDQRSLVGTVELTVNP